MRHPWDPEPEPPKPEANAAPEGAGGASSGTEGAPEEAVAGTAADTTLKQQIDRLEADREDLRQTLIRRQADFDNFRKRVERERRDDRERAVGSLAESILPVLDNFERALAAQQDPAYQNYMRGFEMIFKQMVDLLAHHGVARMQSPVGKQFDPHCHHAIERVETTEQPEGTVIGEVQAGYKFRDRVLRPAQVRVAVHAAPHAAFPKTN